MSHIGKQKAIQVQIDAAAKACEMPYPVAMPIVAQLKDKADRLRSLPAERFNDDGTLKPELKENGKVIAIVSSYQVSPDPIKIKD